MTETRFIKLKEARKAVKEMVKLSAERTADRMNEKYEPVISGFGDLLFLIFYDNYHSGINFETNIEEMKEGFAKNIARLTFEQVKKSWEK